MKDKSVGYFPEALEESCYPQLLAFKSGDNYYKLCLETFHLYEKALFYPDPGEHRHDVFHIVLYHTGENQFRFKGKLIDSSPGLLVLCSPGEAHSFTPLLKQPTGYHEITFSLVAEGQKLVIPFAELLSGYFGGKNRKIQLLRQLDTVEAGELENLYFELEKALRNQDTAFLFPVYRQLERILEFVFTCQSQSKEYIEDEGIQAARRCIESNFKVSLRLKELAAIAGMSPEHFCRKFKHIYGEPPLEMRNRLRINAAARLISYSSRPLKQVAVELGFSDVYHFSKMFKKYTGKSPGKIRNKK